jgi:hypothetical protein
LKCRKFGKGKPNKSKAKEGKKRKKRILQTKQKINFWGNFIFLSRGGIEKMLE